MFSPLPSTSQQYALVKWFRLNVGKLVEQFILDYPENNFSGNISHLALIILLFIKGGITFRDTEVRCSRSSPLTLTRVLKAPAQGEEVERDRKRKRVASKLPREVAPTEVSQSNQCSPLVLKKHCLLRTKQKEGK